MLLHDNGPGIIDWHGNSVTETAQGIDHNAEVQLEQCCAEVEYFSVFLSKGEELQQYGSTLDSAVVVRTSDTPAATN